MSDFGDFVDPTYLNALADSMRSATDPANCPANLQESLMEYVQRGIPVGGFLEAILTNDLMGAVKRADHVNIHRIPAICSFVYNELPHNCHGSIAIYEAWLAAYAKARQEEL